MDYTAVRIIEHVKRLREMRSYNSSVCPSVCHTHTVIDTWSDLLQSRHDRWFNKDVRITLITVDALSIFSALSLWSYGL